MDFALFVVLNAVLLIRPEELYPEIAGLRLYLIVITICLFVALPKILRQFSLDELKQRPITVCVLGLLGAATLSQLARGHLDVVEEFIPEFAKVIAYYLLLVAVIDSPRRFKWFLGFQVAFICVVATLGVLQHHEVIDFEALKPYLQRGVEKDTGEYVESFRMRSTGIFNDPNDLCLILVFGSICCLYQATSLRNRALQVLWLLPIGLFFYALILTQSRGGLLGLLAAVTALCYAKFGWKRTLPLVLLGAPALVLAIGGRQSDINLDGADTGHARIMLWAEGFGLMFSSPNFILTGIGVMQLAEETGLVAHNSFVHAYVEMGVIGGTLFLGAFVTAMLTLLYWPKIKKPRVPPELAAAWPFVIAIVAGYSAGVFSLSRNYTVTTYMCLGIATAFLALTVPQSAPIRYRVSQPWAKSMALVGIAGLVFLKFFTQFALIMGV
jgi:O-Antigen ligase